MIRYRLKRRDVATLVNKPLNSAGGYSNSTVDKWLSGDHRVPELALELLELKLAKQPQRDDPWQRLIRQPLPYPSQREMEGDLAQVLANIERGNLPATGRTAKPLALRRAGYWLELIAQLGGPRFAQYRDALLDQASRLHGRLSRPSKPAPLRAGDSHAGSTMDDLAIKWGLSRGADIRRFRQMANTGHV